MGIATRLWPAALLLVGGLALAAPASAQVRDRNGFEPRWNDGRSRAGAAGHREGLEQGAKDARSGRGFNYTDEKTYRNADRGYQRELGDRETYRRLFRSAYVSGYRDGYYGRGSQYGYPDDRRRAVPRMETSPRYPNNQRYPGQLRRGFPAANRYPGYGQGLGRANGFNDGYGKGLEDGRDRDRYDPTRHGWYRSADRGFSRQLGSKDAYRNQYRAACREGYERGYRDAHAYRAGNDRRW